VIGRTIQLNDTNVEIVGVMPAEFELPTAEVQLWRPIYQLPASSSRPQAHGSSRKPRPACNDLAV
jgi:hypothetical protein